MANIQGKYLRANTLWQNLNLSTQNYSNDGKNRFIDEDNYDNYSRADDSVLDDSVLDETDTDTVTSNYTNDTPTMDINNLSVICDQSKYILYMFLG